MSAPQKQVEQWATSADIGMYFEFPAGEDGLLRVAIEKDLECLDEPVSERDPDAFPRSTSANQSC